LRLIRFILAVLDGEDLDALRVRLGDPVFVRILRENPHLANLQAGAMGLAWGVHGDREAARRQRDLLDENVASGFFPESVLWAELGLALAAAAHGDLDDARAHAETGRSWERRAALVTCEVDAVLRLIEAVAAKREAGHGGPTHVLDAAVAGPSLLSTLLRHSAVARQLEHPTAT
jgi:hypothetical protein